jgi:hypothetical protein
MDDLHQAIELLYETFARYPRPVCVEFCPCGCTKPGETASLLSKPLRELTFEDTDSYVFSAMTTQGTENDFQYFLPRLLEGLTTGVGSYMPDMLFCKLPYAKWLTWPDNEQKAVRAYLNGLWHASLSNFPLREELCCFFGIENVLQGIAQTGVPLHPYLEVWSEMQSRSADQHLIQFVTQFGSDFTDGATLRYAWWEKAISQGDELRDWLLQTSTLERVVRSQHMLPCDGCEHLFEPALATLRSEKAKVCGGDFV